VDAATLRDQIIRRAAVLSETGIGHGSVVAIVHGGGAHFLADLLSVWQVGAAAACLDPALTPPEREIIERFIEPAALLVGCSSAAGKFSVPALDLSAAPPATAQATGERFDLDDRALVLFTSGSTGRPKGVVLTFRALLTRVD
jgi:long-chain acyl-CoA synthetase